jgi:hypothetical protein
MRRWRQELATYDTYQQRIVTRLRKMMLEELQARKITALVLGWVEDSVIRSDSRGVGAPGSSSRCEVASIAW